MSSSTYLPASTRREELDGLSEFIFDIPNDYPFLEGHFPNNPIIPAVTQIGWCLDAIEIDSGTETNNYTISRFKFTSPLPPSKSIRLQMSKKDQRYGFKVFVEQQRYSSGTISLPASGL